MNRRQFTKTTAVVGLIMAMTGSLFAAGGSSKKPNVILIMTDDQGYGDLACLGNSWIDGDVPLIVRIGVGLLESYATTIPC